MVWGQRCNMSVATHSIQILWWPQWCIYLCVTWQGHGEAECLPSFFLCDEIDHNNNSQFLVSFRIVVKVHDTSVIQMHICHASMCSIRFSLVWSAKRQPASTPLHGQWGITQIRAPVAIEDRNKLSPGKSICCRSKMGDCWRTCWVYWEITIAVSNVLMKLCVIFTCRTCE